MLIICDFCNNQKSEVIKLPNSFEVNESYIMFPSDKKYRYTNICLDCIGVRKEDPFV